MRKYIALCAALIVFQFSGHAQIPGAAIDVLHYNFALQLNDTDNNINGQAAITVKFLKSTGEFNLDLVKKNAEGKGMLVAGVTENGKKLKFVQNSGNVKIYTNAKLNSIHNYKVSYSGVPADGLIISTNKFGHRTFFGDNWPNRAHNWLPCVDVPADKASVDFVVTAPDHYQVISNGLKIKEQQLPNHLKLTHWHEATVLPTKVMVIGVAAFAIEHQGDVNKIPVYTYVFPESRAVGFKSYSVAKEILPFFINKVGPYSYEKLANVQSKTIFGGMENASAIFYFEESVTSPEIEELMAHEIAHQWFGDGASEKSFWHLWLSEGFATYMTNLYLENKYGADTLKKRLIADRKKVLDFEKKRLTPVLDSAVKSDYMQLLNANSYEKGGWVLHMLRRKLGDDLFWKGIRNYYAKYKGSNANTDDLRRVMEQTSGQDLKQFFNQWLRTAGHPDLNVAWHYDAGKGVINFAVEQTQQTPYEFPLTYAVDGKLYTATIKDKINNFEIPAKAAPADVIFDPEVNLLASFNNVNWLELMLKYKVQ
ncbi:M1 family metallopeptidase [Mucilaginibacter sabulilitoris]|uniref:Aminopeptidase N n=1 Tax=Mucilaginibacter sabulilitoris TaxID=1173583 RepID=A0ABZ0TPA3_9SPHI|nr:M1 family metallopeptidase [Mucilaginibacter sabulilitoris]WPU94282.1 M1 family metallopeptidase [Mucilaginibacter sabulilitoris]